MATAPVRDDVASHPEEPTYREVALFLAPPPAVDQPTSTYRTEGGFSMSVSLHLFFFSLRFPYFRREKVSRVGVGLFQPFFRQL